ncbi:MAG: diguanylate cyclase [Sterolibacterium sp.]|nr:diguanylate cyclase [Sterolibacterium sp.]
MTIGSAQKPQHNAPVFDPDHSFAVKLMQHLVVPTFVINTDCRVIIWNKACERLTGVPAAEIMGTREHWSAFYAAPRPCLADLLASGRGAEADSLYAVHDDPSGNAFGMHAENWCVMPRLGSELYLAIDAGPIYDEDGNLLAVVETLRDMTEHKRTQTTLEYFASRDSLTGISNRRSFDDKLDIEWRRALRDDLPIALVMVDVDHFKRYNDTYGHQSGDECLRQVAQAMQNTLFRPSDLVARYGGEEFTMILPATDSEGVMVVAERIQDGIARLTIPHSRGEQGRVTLSIGIASVVPQPGTGCEALIAAADAALYRAKHDGRNRIVVAKSVG